MTDVERRQKSRDSLIAIAICIPLLAVITVGVQGPNEVHAGHEGKTHCPADVNADLVVDISDIALAASWFGDAVPPAPSAFDIALSGFVDISDLVQMTALFGQICFPPGAHPPLPPSAYAPFPAEQCSDWQETQSGGWVFSCWYPEDPLATESYYWDPDSQTAVHYQTCTGYGGCCVLIFVGACNA